MLLLLVFFCCNWHFTATNLQQYFFSISSTQNDDCIYDDKFVDI